jgi:cytochrome bd-type quinol oxidase subunit 2
MFTSLIRSCGSFVKSGKASRFVLVLTLVFVLASVIQPAYAAGPQSPGLQDGGPGHDPGKPITDVVNALTKVFVNIALSVCVALLTLSVSRGGLSAQVANFVGSSMALSQAWMSIISSIFPFLVSALTVPIVWVIVDAIKSYVVMNPEIPHF